MATDQTRNMPAFSPRSRSRTSPTSSARNDQAAQRLLEKRGSASASPALGTPRAPTSGRSGVVISPRSTCVILLLAAVLSACGGAGDAGDESDAPEYAATPRKSLESWVAAVRAGDVEMMCRLLSTRTCTSVESRLLPLVRAEMRGLKGDLHYGAIDIGAPEARIVIGVVSGDSPAAYAVPVARGKTQWSIDDEERQAGFAPRCYQKRPPAR